MHVRRLRGDTPGVMQALAQLGNLGDALGDDLVLLQSNVEGLEAGATAEEFTQGAVRVFNRLPDELVAKAPELARRVAAQVGRADPATLQRVCGWSHRSIDRRRGRVADVLVALQQAARRSPRSCPLEQVAADMASAARTRTTPRSTATPVGRSWLISVVTPKLSGEPFGLPGRSGRESAAGTVLLPLALILCEPTLLHDIVDQMPAMVPCHHRANISYTRAP